MAEAQEHLATCYNCHVVLESTQQTILLYRERGKQLVMNPTRHAVLFQHLREALMNAPGDDGADSSSAT
jgi:hypothetical protein